MPLLIIRWAHSRIKGEKASMTFTVNNVGMSTALNGVLTHGDQERKLPAIEPGRQESSVGALPGEVVDGKPRLVGTVTLIYEDAIGNRIKTECRPATTADRPMYETSLEIDGRWHELKMT